MSVKCENFRRSCNSVQLELMPSWSTNQAWKTLGICLPAASNERRRPKLIMRRTSVDRWRWELEEEEDDDDVTIFLNNSSNASACCWSTNYMTMIKHFRISLLGASMSYVETTKALIERRSLEDHTTGTNRQLFTYHHHLKTTADWGTWSTGENCWSPLQQLAKYFQRLQVSWDESNKKSEKKARIKSTAPAIEDALSITSSVVVSPHKHDFPFSLSLFFGF